MKPVKLARSLRWWEEHLTRVSVADWAVEVGELATPQAVVHFFEKPFCYEDLFEAYRESVS